MEFQTTLQGAKLAITAWVSERPPVTTTEEKKALSNFLSRKVGEVYWTIRSESRIVIISKTKHPDAVRLRTKYIIETLIPDVLNEPWNQSFTKRITQPHGQKVKKEKNTDTAYAQWVGAPEGGDIAMKAFNQLRTDPERAQWLLHHIDEVTLYTRGNEIIEEYQLENYELSEVGVPPPFTPPTITIDEVLPCQQRL